MVYFPILFFCAAGLFMTLLQDRYRIWTTVGGMAGAYILAVAVASILRGKLNGPLVSSHVPYLVGVALFFGASLFLFSNNLLQKLFVALLCLANFSFSLLFVPLLLGVMPFSVAGAAGGVISASAGLFINLLMVLCLYRPMQRFSQRGPSMFLSGMALLALFQYLLCTGSLDRLCGLSGPVRRLMLATALYAGLIFCFRSVYHAGRWQSQAAKEAAWGRMLEMESRDYLDMLAAVREVRAAQKTGEYALDTIEQLLRDEQAGQVPEYIHMVKRNAQNNPILTRYHENPYLNAVIATKSAFAAQNEIEFECNAAAIDAPVKTAELCILTDELLTRACKDAAVFEGQRRLRFTSIPGEDSLRLEVVYTGELPQKPSFSPRGKQFRDLLDWLFDDPQPQDAELRGLDNSAEIVLAHSGSLTVSGTEDGVILQATLLF